MAVKIHSVGTDGDFAAKFESVTGVSKPLPDDALGNGWSFSSRTSKVSRFASIRGNHD